MYKVTYTGATSPAAPTMSLDGGQITLAGPGLPGGSVILKEMTSGTLGPIYQATPLTLVDGGTYTLTGAGGTQVKAFSKVSATLPNNFTTNVMSISSIDRSKALPITWTGTGFDNVVIGASTLTFTSTSVQAVIVTCLVPANLGTYSVPSGALQLLTPVSGPLSGGFGSLSVSTAPATQGNISSQGFTGTTLTPDLVQGGKITYGGFYARYSVQQSVTVQ